MATSANSRSPDDYRIACICPMPKEAAAMQGMLDADHDELLLPKSRNTYVYGNIGEHNIVIAFMPNIGNSRAAAIANQLLNDFPVIELALLVGIGGGIPSEKVDIRLGDVVVGKKSSGLGAVVQYDLIKLVEGLEIKPTSVLALPSLYYMGRVDRLDAKHRIEGTNISQHVSQMLKKHPKMRKKRYGRPNDIEDLLFPTDVLHVSGPTCENCDLSRIVIRPERPDEEPEIHYGTVASGNFVVKDPILRDRLAKELNAYCIDMEAAGISQDLNCLVVRGISDYSDNHKRDGWQEYAAATAAAYVKELLLSIPKLQGSTGSNIQDLNSQGLRPDPNPLPIDRISLSSSPVGSDVSKDDIPLVNSGDFIGRNSELNSMRGALSSRLHSTQHNIVSLCGISGIGKSQLAKEYARIYRVDHGSVFWFDAASEDALRISLKSVYYDTTKDLSHGDPHLYTQRIFADFDEWLSRYFTEGWMIVYENYNEPKVFDIEKYYPRMSHGSIIITTRSSDISQGTRLRVSEFRAKDDALALLEYASGRSHLHKDSGASELLDALQGFPLAISTAGAFLKQSDHTCGQYLQAWGHARDKLRDSHRDLPEYPQRVLYPIWNLCLKFIEKTSTAAANLLKLLAYFDNEDIWFDLITAGKRTDRRDKPAWYVEVASHWIHFERAMRVLSDFNLIEANFKKDSYRLQSCIQDWAIGLSNETASDSFRIAFECVANAEKTSTGKGNGEGLQSRIYRHVVRISDPRFRRNLQGQDCYYTANIAFVLGKEYQFDAATRFYEIALSNFSNDTAGKTNVSLLTMANLAIQYDNNDRLEDAIWLLKKALSTYERLRKTDTMDMIRVMHCLTWIILRQGDITGAQAMCKRAHECCKKYLTPHHELRLAVSLNSQCLSLVPKDLNTKRKILKPAKIRQSTLRGALHPTTIGIVSAICALFDGQDQRNHFRLAVMIEEMIGESVRAAKLSNSEAVLARNMLDLATSTLIDLCRRQADVQKDRSTLLMYLMRLMHVIELTESSDSGAWKTLAEALFLDNDIVHARIARDIYLLYEFGTDDSFIDCNVCKQENLSHKTGRYICTKCRDVDLCSDCAQKYRAGANILKTCRDHQIINRLKHCTPTPDELRFGTRLREKPLSWLGNLRTEYLARLNALDSNKKRAPHLVLPDVEKVKVVTSKEKREK